MTRTFKPVLALAALLTGPVFHAYGATVQLTSASQESTNDQKFVDPDPAGTVYGNSVTFNQNTNALTFSRGAGGAFETDVAGATYGVTAFASGTTLVSGGGFQGPGLGDPILIKFAVPVTQFALNIEDFSTGNYYVQFTAFTVTATSVSSLGTFQANVGNDPNTLSFEGLTSSSAPISFVIFDDVSSPGALSNSNVGSNNLIFGNLVYLDAGSALQAPSPVPEPAPAALMGLGLLGLSSLFRRMTVKRSR